MLCRVATRWSLALFTPLVVAAQAPSEWPVHSMERPKPPVVAPPAASTPTPPPADAIVLFDGRSLDEWVSANNAPARWRIVDGAMVVVRNTGSVSTRRVFGDVQLHVEFRTVAPPTGDGQNRSNSGIFLMGRYEVQVLDSYENPTYADGQAAALYGQHPPRVNASRTSGEWQSYDITFRRPRFGVDGRVIEPARITMYHNGVLVHQDQAFQGATAHMRRAVYEAHESRLPLSLQDHGDAVRFRNIWVRDLENRSPNGQLSSIAGPAQFTDRQREQKLRSVFPSIDSLVASFAASRRVPGYAYGIVIDGKLAHVVAGGIRETRTRAPVDTSTVFRIASMSKSFAALAILQLRDEGKLSLDDPVARHVPELASLRYASSDAPRITIRHLLTHSAGFPEDNPWGDQQLDATEDAFSAMMRSGIPFSTAPGTAYEYSNYGFAVLGRIVTNVSGVPYARYLRERILAPLGMNSTTLESSDVNPNRLAYGYRVQDGEWLLEPALPDGAFGVMGGMLTTPADLTRWVAYMLDAWPARSDDDNDSHSGPAPAGDRARPVQRSSVREMQQMQRYGSAFTNVTADAQTLVASGYGYGLGVSENCDFRHIVAHTGGLPGYGSIMRWLPEHGVGIIALGSLTYTGWGTVVDQAFGMLKRSGGLEPRTPQPSPVLELRRAQVTRLVQRWSAPLADSLAAMNLFRDESAERRAAQFARMRDAAGGSCVNEGPFVVENALRGRWKMRCATGDLVVRITLAPTEPAQVQFLSVTPTSRGSTLSGPVACRRS
jgi:CubicO group peptidase (beta-lactamase class C family)